MSDFYYIYFFESVLLLVHVICFRSVDCFECLLSSKRVLFEFETLQGVNKNVTQIEEVSPKVSPAHTDTTGLVAPKAATAAAPKSAAAAPIAAAAAPAPV
jgi:hypothetical protein